MPPFAAEVLAQEPSVVADDVAVGVTELLEEARRALDVGEEEGDRAAWERSHARELRPRLASSRVNAVAPDPRRWKALILICAAIFVVVLDIAIVNVALPTIQDDLDFADENLQWVITAYGLTYGGFLLLGGRAADLLGRRLVFMGGLALFGLASLVCGLSTSSGMLIAARGFRGSARRSSRRRRCRSSRSRSRKAASATRRSGPGALSAGAARPRAS